MKLIEAVVNKLRLHEVQYALNEAGVDDYTESTMVCHGHEKGRTMVYRGAKFIANVVKVKLEIIAADDCVAKIVEVIGSVAKSGQEECRIAVRPYPEVR